METRVELLDRLLNCTEAMASLEIQRPGGYRKTVVQQLYQKTSGVPIPPMVFQDILRAQQQEIQARASVQAEEEQKIQASQTDAFGPGELEQLCGSLSAELCFSSLYPWQQEFLSKAMGRRGLRENVLLCAGTASGKTHVARLCVLEVLVRQRRSAVFVVPYVALVDELTQRFREMLPAGCGLCSLTGLKSVPQFLCARPTLFIATIEKAQLLSRQLLEQGLTEKVGLFVIDELHTCAEKGSERAPRLELFVTFLLALQAIEQASILRLKNTHTEPIPIGTHTRRFKIMAMSATIDNHTHFADWLKARAFHANFRPVQLQEYVMYQAALYDIATGTLVRPVQQIVDSPLFSAFLTAKKPLIVFCGTRAKVRQLAAQFAQIIAQKYKQEAEGPKRILREELHERLNTKQPTVLQGVAAHSSDFLSADRQLIEEAYREGVLHTIFATTTLAAGVNLPAKSVFIVGTKIGIQELDAQYYRQMAGRAGRTKQAKEGFCVLVVDNKEQILGTTKLKEKYDCLSHSMSEEFINNTFNSLLMLGYQFEMSFQDILSKTLYGTQNPGSTPREFKSNVGYLQKINLIALQNQTKQITLTPLGKAAADAGLHAAQAHYYSLLLGRVAEVGFDVLSEDLVTLFIAGLSLQQYQAFDPPSDAECPANLFLQSLQQPTQGGFVNFELIGNELGAFCFRFMGTSADEIADQIGSRGSDTNQLRYYILQRTAALKAAIARLQQGVKTTAEDETVKTAVSMSGAVALFLESLGYTNLRALIQAQQQKIRALIEDDITDLLQIRYVGVNRARALKQAGFHSAHDIVSAGKERLSLLVDFGEGTEMAVERIWAGAMELVAQ